MVTLTSFHFHFRFERSRFQRLSRMKKPECRTIC